MKAQHPALDQTALLSFGTTEADQQVPADVVQQQGAEDRALSHAVFLYQEGRGVAWRRCPALD